MTTPEQHAAIMWLSEMLANICNSGISCPTTDVICPLGAKCDTVTPKIWADVALKKAMLDGREWNEVPQ